MSRTRARALSLGAVALLTVLVGCSAASEPADTAAGSEPPAAADDPSGDEQAAEVPDECVDAFPQAIGPADLEDVAALPADWPDPPAGSTLCLTASGLGSPATETMSYATPADEAGVLAHYEGALTGFSVERTPSPTGGEMLTGDGAGIGFQIQPGAGTVVIVLQPTG